MSAHLLARIEQLEAENAFLRDALAGRIEIPAAWGLTAKQSEILTAIYRCRFEICPHDRIEAAVYGAQADPPESNVIPVHIARIRAMLRQQFGINTISPIWGAGYRLAPVVRQELDRLNARERLPS